MLFFRSSKDCLLFLFLTVMVFFSKNILADSSPYQCIHFFKKTSIPRRSLEFSDLDSHLQKLTLIMTEARELIPLSGWYKSAASQVIRKLMHDWDMRFLYDDGPVASSLFTSFSTLRSPKTDVLISSEFLKDPEKLTNALHKFESQFQKLLRLIDLGIIMQDITVSQEGLEFTILRIRQPIQDPSLRWMQKAIEKFKTKVVFTFEENEPDLIDYAGFATEKTIYLNSKNIMPFGEKEFMRVKDRATLAHELVHAFRSFMQEKGNTALFWFRATDETGILSENLPPAYQKQFRTDEFEAWKMSHHFTKDKEKLRDLFLVQLPWLKEARDLLEDPHFVLSGTIENMEHFVLEINLKESNATLHLELQNVFLDNTHLKSYLYNEINRRIKQLERWTSRPLSADISSIPF